MIEFQRERKVLNTKRLDLDAAKSRLRKAKSLEAQSNVSLSGFFFWDGLVGLLV